MFHLLFFCVRPPEWFGILHAVGTWFMCLAPFPFVYHLVCFFVLQEACSPCLSSFHFSFLSPISILFFQRKIDNNKVITHGHVIIVNKYYVNLTISNGVSSKYILHLFYNLHCDWLYTVHIFIALLKRQLLVVSRGKRCYLAFPQSWRPLLLWQPMCRQAIFQTPSPANLSAQHQRWNISHVCWTSWWYQTQSFTSTEGKCGV